MKAKPIGIRTKKRVGTRHRDLLSQFKEFHRMNPHVFDELLKIAQEVKQAGINRIGPQFVMARLRWLSTIEGVVSNTGYAFCENYSPFYARLIMMTDSTLEGFFDVKQTRAWSGNRKDLIDCLNNPTKVA